MKRILITRATVCGGFTVSAGDVIDASHRDADFLVAIGKARHAAEDARQDTQEPDPVVVDQRASNAAPRRPGRPRKAVA
jgi:hypothetical protein